MFFETRHCARMSSWRAQHIVTRSRQSRVGVLVGTAALFISSGCATVQQGLAELETLAAATSSTNGGTIVVGRTVEGSVRDSLVYHFDAAPGQELYGVIEGRGRNRYPQVQVEFYNTTRNARLVTARAYGGGEQGATRVFNPPEAGRFTVVIQNYHLNGRNTPVDDGTPFRFSLRTINRRPESIPPEVRAGQVVNGERIDDFHDIDEFTITARAGQTIQVALQGLGGAWCAGSGTGSHCPRWGRAGPESVQPGRRSGSGHEHFPICDPPGRWTVHGPGQRRLSTRARESVPVSCGCAVRITLPIVEGTTR